MAQLHIPIMTGRSPEYHLSRAEEHLRLWRDGDQLQGPCVPRRDAVANDLNFARAGIIAAQKPKSTQETGQRANLINRLHFRMQAGVRP
jgi:hypothetical protein